jgi:hypothetical protein
LIKVILIKDKFVYFYRIMELRKLIITHLLLNLYLLVLIQPSLPVLEYLINYDYIVNELCENRDKPVMSCNGKCYLGDLVDQNRNLNHKEQVPLPPEMELLKYISFNTVIIPDTPVSSESKKLTPESVPNFNDRQFSTSLLRPPIV